MRQDRPRLTPRMLTSEQAAQYLGYETTAILQHIPVQPVQMAPTGKPGSAPKYDRHALDAWLDRLSGLTSPAEEQGGAANDAETAYGIWKARRGR